MDRPGQATGPDHAPGGKDAGKNGDGEEPDRALVNYTQAWSMVHFLVHAEDGRYRQAFSEMIRDISRGRNPQDAFRARLGRNVEAFEKRYRQWWMQRKEDDSAGLYIKAVVQTLTSFLARAVSQGQRFGDARRASCR